MAELIALETAVEAASVSMAAIVVAVWQSFHGDAGALEDWLCNQGVKPHHLTRNLGQRICKALASKKDRKRRQGISRVGQTASAAQHLRLAPLDVPNWIGEVKIRGALEIYKKHRLEIEGSAYKPSKGTRAQAKDRSVSDEAKTSGTSDTASSNEIGATVNSASVVDTGTPPQTDLSGDLGSRQANRSASISSGTFAASPHPSSSGDDGASCIAAEGETLHRPGHGTRAHEHVETRSELLHAASAGERQENAESPSQGTLPTDKEYCDAPQPQHEGHSELTEAHAEMDMASSTAGARLESEKILAAAWARVAEIQRQAEANAALVHANAAVAARNEAADIVQAAKDRAHDIISQRSITHLPDYELCKFVCDHMKVLQERGHMFVLLDDVDCRVPIIDVERFRESKEKGGSDLYITIKGDDVRHAISNSAHPLPNTLAANNSRGPTPQQTSRMPRLAKKVETDKDGFVVDSWCA
jgi:hypothetical protein